jgi:hypothetical protein
LWFGFEYEQLWDRLGVCFVVEEKAKIIRQV